MKIPSNEELDALKYKQLQAVALELEKEYGVQLNRSAKKSDLLDEVKKVIADNAISEEENPAVEESKEEEKPAEEEPEPAATGEKLYACNSFYRDLASGWSFIPKLDAPGKPLPKKLSPGLKNALERGKIFEVKGE